MISKKLMAIFVFFLTLVVQAQSNLYDANAIPEELKVDANASIRFEDYSVKIESVKKMSVEFKRIITVFNENGNSLVQAGLGYDDYFKIKKIQAVIFDKLGNKIKSFKKKDFVDHSAVDGGTLYTDSRVLFLNYSPVDYPYTVEFVYEAETSNTAVVPDWQPINDYYLSIESSCFNVEDNASLDLRYKENNFENYTIKSNNKINRISYSLSNQKAIKPEDFSPDLKNITPVVLVAVNSFFYNGVYGEAKNWNEFGLWYNSLLLGRDKVSEKTRAKIIEITSSVVDPIKKAEIVYDFVQKNTRYISVQVGIGGVQPISAMEVDDLKYGDCKGLTNYTKALLKIAGVESYYSIVEAGRYIQDMDYEFASLEEGNHIILAIPKGEDFVWLDCTSQVHPFGFIGGFTDNRNALMIKPGESEIVKTTKYSNKTNKEIIKSVIEMDTDTSINALVKIESHGIVYDDRFLIERESNAEITELYERLWSYLNKLEIETFKFNNLKREAIFNEEITLKAKDYSYSNQGKLVMKPNVFSRSNFIPTRYKSRNTPLVIQRGYYQESYFTIIIPEKYEVESLPENISLSSKFGEYNIKISYDKEGSINYKRTFLLKEGKYPKEEYSNYRDFRKEILKFDKSIIVLKPKI